MAGLSAEAWDERYRKGETGWELKRPAPPLARWFQEHSPQGLSALVPGCGRGHEARLLASLGARGVVAVDLSSRAFDEARLIQPDISKKVHWILGDVRQLPHSAWGPFDLVVEHTCFCALAPEDREKYLSEVRRALEPDGKFVGLFYVDFENPEGPPFGISQGDLRDLLEKHFAVTHWEPHPKDSVPERAGKEVLVEAKQWR